MAILTLPGRSVSAIVLAVAAIGGGAANLCVRGDVTWLGLAAALAISAFAADSITALAHFSFDYIFPYDFPIFGPIAEGFNQHHDKPCLDPKDAVENFTLGEPIVMLTAYTMRMAQLLDPHCDMLLVGDSLGQVIYGLPSTVPVTLEMMCAHGAAVVRGSWHALVAVDMPFGSYEARPSRPSPAPRGS
jgi:hypothetical protein